MSKPRTHASRRAGRIRTVEQKLTTPFIWSFMGHLILCFFFFGLPHLWFEGRAPMRVIPVQLVSLSTPATVPAPAPQKQTAETKPTPTVAPTPKASIAKPKAKDTVSLTPSKMEKKLSMKKKTYKRERVLESAIKNAEKRVETSRPDLLQQALDQIESDLREEETRADDTAATTSTGGSGRGKPTSDTQLAYYAEIGVSIQKNWAFSTQLAGGETGLFNEVFIKVMRSGEIKEIWFDRRSGNSYFDESTRKAILKSNPLPPIPDEIPGRYKELVIRFTPEGLTQ